MEDKTAKLNELKSAETMETTIIKKEVATKVIEATPVKITTTPSLTKIAPKPTSVSNGQFVFIQSPSGTAQTIRIAGTSKTVSSVANIPSGFQLVKTADGFLQVKQKVPTTNSMTANVVKAATTPQTTNAPVRRIIVKGSSGQQLIVSTTQPSTNTTVATTGSGTRTYTVAQAEQMGLLSAAKLKELVSAATTQKKVQQFTPILPASSTTSSATTTISKTTTPSQPATKKIILQPSSGAKPITIPQNIVKLAQSGQIKAVNIPGKGIQYIRVTTSANQSGQTNVSGTASKLVANSSTAHSSGQSKLLVQSKSGKQTITLLSTANDTDAGKSGKNATVTTVTTKQIVKPIQTITAPKLQVKPIIVEPVTIKVEKEEQEKQTTVKENSQLNESIDIPKPIVKTQESSSVCEDSTQSLVVPTPQPAPITSSTILKRQSSRDDSANSETVTSNKIVFKIETENQTIAETNVYDLVKDAPEAPRRKHCNCTKSQCLKLYCDCFANGEFCFNCNCKECFNNLENEEERLKAIKICLERNPHAFKPKIGKSKEHNEMLRRHTKGCNCKRSGCLKNYCECYEAKISCSGNCKCIGCRNVEESYNRLSYVDSMLLPRPVAVPQKRPYEREQSPPLSSKKPCNFMTQDVIEATIQCVIAQADECQQKKMDKGTSERMILEEFGRCLVEIIEFSMKNNEN